MKRFFTYDLPAYAAITAAMVLMLVCLFNGGAPA